jgi:transcriptional regulator with XRE-family HTH domain
LFTEKNEEPRVISKLSKYRKNKGLSQDDLAKLSGLTKTTIQNWENGRNLGAVLRVLKVCQELNVDIRDLFELGEETEEAKEKSVVAS